MEGKMGLERDNQLRQWLAAEREDRIEEADLAFGAVFRLVAHNQPGPGFVDSVLAALRLPPPVARPALLASRWARLAVAASLILVSVPLASVRGMSLLISVVSRLGDAIGLAVGLYTWSRLLVDAALRAGNITVDVGGGLQIAAATPVAVGVLLTSMFFAASAAYALQRLLISEQELPRC